MTKEEKEQPTPREMADEIQATLKAEGIRLVTFYKRGTTYDSYFVRGNFLQEGAEGYVKKAVEGLAPDASDHDKNEVLATSGTAP